MALGKAPLPWGPREKSSGAKFIQQARGTSEAPRPEGARSAAFSLPPSPSYLCQTPRILCTESLRFPGVNETVATKGDGPGFSMSAVPRPRMQDEAN